MTSARCGATFSGPRAPPYKATPSSSSAPPSSSSFVVCAFVVRAPTPSAEFAAATIAASFPAGNWLAATVAPYSASPWVTAALPWSFCSLAPLSLNAAPASAIARAAAGPAGASSFKAASAARRYVGRLGSSNMRSLHCLILLTSSMVRTGGGLSNSCQFLSLAFPVCRYPCGCAAARVQQAAKTSATYHHEVKVPRRSDMTRPSGTMRARCLIALMVD